MLEFYHYARKGGTLHEILLGLWMNSCWVNQEKWVYGTTGLYCTQGKLHCITAQHAIQQYWRNQFMMAFIIIFFGGVALWIILWLALVLLILWCTEHLGINCFQRVLDCTSIRSKGLFKHRGSELHLFTG